MPSQRRLESAENSGLLLKENSVATIFDWRESEMDPRVERATTGLLVQLDALRELTVDVDCRSALDKLKLWLESLQCTSKTWFQLTCWPAAVSPEFVSKLQIGHPAALMIYACWCRGAHARYKEWFVEGSVGQAMQFVKVELASSGSSFRHDL